MKIVINYDLIDKVREAKTGFSLHKYMTVVGLTNGIVIPMMILGAEVRDTPVIETIEEVIKIFLYSLFHNAMYSFGSSFFCKDQAYQELIKLSSRLCDFCIETSPELLKDAYKYATLYDVEFDSFPPKINQKKYIMVPVNNDWGNNERSIVQEHTIGTSSYVLSYGEPEKNKVYSYGRRRVYNNGR